VAPQIRMILFDGPEMVYEPFGTRRKLTGINFEAVKQMPAVIAVEECS
jgi:hypothetical protein